MSFKQIIKLICVTMVFILISSAIVMVLPESYRQSDGIQISTGKINGLESIKENFKGLIKITSQIEPIEILTESIHKPPEASVDIENSSGLNIIEIDTDDYYKKAYGKSGEALKNTLNDIIDGHEELTYKEVWAAVKETDQDPNNESNVILIYTGRSQSKGDNGTDSDGWNREHVWAKSHGDFGTSKGAGTDLHHIRPADVTVNSSRNNKNFDNSEYSHKEAVLCRHDKDSFEPRDPVKGDVARMLFYMAVRYEGENKEPDLELVEYMNESKEPYHGKLETLLEWHKQDPVSNFERRRNNIIDDKYQGNRNPFIDHPEWVEEIWKVAS